MFIITYKFVGKFLIFSGNIVIETKFYDDDFLVCTSNVRVFYV